MERLIWCACGHGSGEHDAYGCTRGCACRHDERTVIDRAVSTVREAYRRRWHEPAEAHRHAHAHLHTHADGTTHAHAHAHDDHEHDHHDESGDGP